MDYLQRLTVLKHLHAEISTQLARELADHSDQFRIDEYYRLLEKIDGEVNRIQKMRSYNATTTQHKLRN